MSFATLRELLHRPSESAFQALLGLMLDWDKDSIDIAISYTCEHLDEWPDDLRCAVRWMDVAHPSFRLVRCLNLNDCMIGDAGVMAIASSTFTTELTSLSLAQNQIGDEGVKAIAGSASLQGLRELVLSHNQIGEEGIKALANTKYLANLTILDLFENEIGSEGAHVLAYSKNITRLTTLYLSYFDIGDEGYGAFSNTSQLRVG